MFHETMRRIEDAARGLKLRKDGHLLTAEDALETLENHYGWTWRRLRTDWENGILNDPEFEERVMVLINQFADDRHISRPQVSA